MGWGSALLDGMNTRRTWDRQNRLDAMQEELGRNELALRQAAERRAQAMQGHAMHESEILHQRQGYLDRIKTLGRETAPFARLNMAYPEAGAAPYTGRAYTLDEEIARDPTAAGRQMEDPAMDAARAAGGPEIGPPAPTLGQERQSAVEEAYARFGGAAKARMDAMSALKTRLATAHQRPTKPYTRDLEQEQSALNRMKTQIDNGKRGFILGPDGQWQNINQILDPTTKQRHLEELKSLEAQYQTRLQALNAGYRERLGSPAVTGQLDPAAYYQTRIAQGVPEAQIIADLQGMGFEFDPEPGAPEE